MFDFIFIKLINWVVLINQIKLFVDYSWTLLIIIDQEHTIMQLINHVVEK